jgi:5-methylcytosine-specific restriction enzyme subunit McrC
MTQRQLRRGLLKGYRTEEDALATVRGRWRTADQLRRRFAFPLPVEVTYDDYTEDIAENRLLKAALRRLQALRPQSARLRSRLAETLAAFAVVTDVPYDRSSLPVLRYTRLSEPYRPILELAALIIGNSAVELRQGRQSVTALLFDMNQVFEDFIFESLRVRLAPSFASSDTWRQGQPLALDRAGILCPEPDLAWWRGSRCLFVGDAKYKATAEGRLSDIYQLLAYCTAANLREGLLIYAEQRGGPALHDVRHDGPQLRVEAIDLESSVDTIERRCDELARRVAAVAMTAARAHPRPTVARA